jgi:predicted enzyme related to lactoylglutathione lyase
MSAGRVVHFEIPADDLDRASEFYSGAFGWSMTSIPEAGYMLVSTVDTDDQGRPSEVGAINGGMMKRGAPVLAPIVTLQVDDIDAALATVERLGGSTVRPRESVMDMGFSAYFTDSEGNTVGLWQNAD